MRNGLSSEILFDKMVNKGKVHITFNQEHVKFIKRNVVVGLFSVFTSISSGQAIINADTANTIAKQNTKISDGFYLIMKEGKTRNEITSTNSDKIVLSYINESDTAQKAPAYLHVKRVPKKDSSNAVKLIIGT